MSPSSLVGVFWKGLSVLLLAWMAAAAVLMPADSADAAETERIRQRASGYFDAVASRRFEQARLFILPRSRGDFDPGRSGKGSITGFNILGVELEKGKHSAIVEVEREVAAAVVAGRVKVRSRFRWKLEAGQWFLDPGDPPRTDAEIIKEYYYDKRGAATAAKFDQTVFDFDWAAQGDLVQPRFSFWNLGSEDLVIEKVYGPEWLRNKSEKLHVPAGSSGEITMELDTSSIRGHFRQDVLVRFEPVREMVKLRIKGRVFTEEEIARSPSLSKEAAERKAARAVAP